MMNKLKVFLQQAVFAIAISFVVNSTAQDSEFRQGVVNMVIKAANTIVISDISYQYRSSTLFLTENGGDISTLSIDDFGPHSLVKFSADNSSTPRLKKLILVEL